MAVDTVDTIGHRRGKRKNLPQDLENILGELTLEMVVSEKGQNR